MDKPTKESFIKGRIRSIKFAAKGCWLLITTEHSIIAQLVIGLLISIVGFVMKLSPTEWMFQILAIAIVIIAEAANTAIEYLCDFVHPDFHKKIGFIKDIAAGISFIAAIFAFIIGLIIYLPKFIA